MMMSKNLRNFGLALTITSALYSISAASDDSRGTMYNPSYSLTQSLPALSPQQIASDIQSRFDPLTGRTEYYAPDFDPFENDRGLAGSAALRSASSGISRDGVSLTGGAFVDVSVLYAAGSRDPYDSKGLEHAVFMNGQPINVMTYNAQTLDCTRDTTKVVYDNSYYQGANYGYVGGIYRAYPRYRGHSQYGSYRDSIRYGAWRGLRHNYYGSNGYYNNDGRTYDRNNDRNNDGRSNHNGQGFGDLNSGVVDDVASTVIRNRVNQFEDQIISSSNVIRPDMLGDRRLSTAATRNNTVRPTKGPISRIAPPVKRPPVNAAPIRGAVINPNRPTERRLTNSRAREDRAQIPSRTRTPNTQAPNRARQNLDAAHAREARRAASTHQASTPRVSRPANTAPPRSRAVAPSRAATPARQARPNTAPSRPARSSETRSRPSQARPSQGRSPQKKSKRSVDRAFGGKNKNTSRARRYYPGEYQTSTYVNTQCVKEERLTLHIPAERLAAAKYDGLSIALLDRHGQDVPLYMPPNYVEGFLLANPYMGGAAPFISSSSGPGYVVVPPGRR